jgi:predicted transport protein
MSDIKLFSLAEGQAVEIRSQASDLEKPLQALIEKNLDTLLGVRFLATEYPTGKTHGGRIDTLGLDENCCPVILEYKRSLNENVINQGLYYLDWLLDHKAEFWKLAVERYGKDVADGIDWSAPRLICIASDFTKFDEHAIQQINRNIELIRYRKFGDELLLLEGVNAVVASKGNSSGNEPTKPKAKSNSSLTDKTYGDLLADASPILTELDEGIRQFMMTLGDDVQEKVTKKYIAYKRIKNFASVVVGNQRRLLLQLHLDPDTNPVDEKYGRDMRGKGQWGTGNLQLYVETWEDVERAKPLIRRAYDGT